MSSTESGPSGTAARATIADVAAAAGVTKTTVSRYINGKGYVSDKTARKIAAAMHNLDFTPNRMARSLATQRTNVILYVLRGELSLITQDPGLSKHYAAATAAAAEHDYQVLCMTVNDDNAAKRLQRLLLERFADGYLYFPFSDDDPLLRMFAAGPSPVVTAGRWAVESPNITAVVNDNRAAMRDITRYLLDRGRRRLVYVSGPESVRFARQRLAGFRDAVGAAGEAGCGGAAGTGHDGTEIRDAGAPEIAAVLHAASWSETAADDIWPQLQPLLGGGDGDSRPAADATVDASARDTAGDNVTAQASARTTTGLCTRGNTAGETANRSGSLGIDGIVAANDQLAAGIIRRLQEAGYRVPDDVAVTGFDNADIAGEITPGITTVDQDLGRFGAAMAETLVDVLNGVKPPSNLAFVPTHLVARQSA
ncbi:LacI family DNA-binding transcriptional regulator [Bifidobacterium leontopitheci]|nr:LacI family DNA-binding transcriptional regulator [Bifidobacterium leontopitheci]